MTPTRERIEAARARLARLTDTTVIGHRVLSTDLDDVRTLLAATAEPMETELAEEATRMFPGRSSSVQIARAAYCRGARREGRK